MSSRFYVTCALEYEERALYFSTGAVLWYASEIIRVEEINIEYP